MNRSESPSTALRAPSPPLGEKDGMRGYGSWKSPTVFDPALERGTASEPPLSLPSPRTAGRGWPQAGRGADSWEDSASSQRRDRQRGLRGAQTVPCFQQFSLMLGGPFQDHGTDATGRVALNNSQRSDADDQFTVPVDGMKVRHEWPDDQHPNHDPVKF